MKKIWPGASEIRFPNFPPAISIIFAEQKSDGNIHRWTGFQDDYLLSQALSSEADIPRRGLLARGECLDGRLQMYLTALRGVFIIGPPEPRLLRRLNREWEDPPMIGYTGPIRCLRLYRAVIPPRYSACARYPYLRCSNFNPSTRYVPRDRFAVVKARGTNRGSAKMHANSISMENYNAYLVFRKIVFAHAAVFPLIIYM